MNFLEKIELIKSKLTKVGESKLVEEILDLQLSGGTGGEVLISVCSKLLEIKRTNKHYQLIKKETEELIQYANSIGLIPK
jgi:DNA repair protein RadC